MEITAGNFKLQLEQPQTVKFATPILILPDQFMTPSHHAVPIGYFASIGWEVYAANPYAREDGSPDLALDWTAILAKIRDLITALGRDLIMIGHGVGGLLALALADQSQVKAAVALAPIVPGFNSPLLKRASRLFGLWHPPVLYPPRGRALFDLFADADPFQRDTLIRKLKPASAALARAIGSGKPKLLRSTPTPRLIVGGDADPFAPIVQVRTMAETIGAALVPITGRGHWLFGGRTLERVMTEIQRFLVHNLGGDLLLLYSGDDWA
jgi:pimeloyl-ACP methyl ester carboxylesterase